MIYIFLLLIVVIIISSLAVNSTKEGMTTSNMPKHFPKQIWTFWHDENQPPVVKECIKTWRVHNPDEYDADEEDNDDDLESDDDEEHTDEEEYDNEDSEDEDTEIDDSADKED